MNNRNVIVGFIIAAAVALLFAIAWKSQHELGAHLPPRIECANELEATTQAIQWTIEHGGSIVSTSGTPSMEPYIVGRAVVVWRKVAFGDVSIGSPILYRVLPGTVHLDGTPYPRDAVMLHVLAARDAGGGIPTGLNNAHYENWGRVTDENFVGVVERVFVWKQ